VHLLRDGGEQNAPAYRALNPQGRVPCLVLDDGTVLIQSPAILEWLEETYPEPPLLPKDPVQRAKVRGIGALVGCDIHPLNNVGPLNYLRNTFNADNAAIKAWAGHWVTQGFNAIEQLIEGGDFCVGSAPTLADVYLVPQVAGARRFKVPLDAWFRGGRREMARDLLTGPSSFVADRLDRAAVQRLLAEHESGDRNEQPRIWTLLSLEVWHRELSRS
jgi:maleylacetoacetate isomerase